MTFIFTNKIMNAIIRMYELGEMTKKNSGIFGFYSVMWYLRDNGIAMVKEVNPTKDKVWILTEKGRKIAEKLIEIKKILGEYHEG